MFRWILGLITETDWFGLLPGRRKPAPGKNADGTHYSRTLCECYFSRGGVCPRCKAAVPPATTHRCGDASPTPPVDQPTPRPERWSFWFLDARDCERCGAHQPACSWHTCPEREATR